MRKPLTQLLACPFCGNKATLEKQDASLPELPKEWWTVTCSHDTPYHCKRGARCPAMPMAIGDTREAAAAYWNTRKGKGVKDV